MYICIPFNFDIIIINILIIKIVFKLSFRNILNIKVSIVAINHVYLCLHVCIIIFLSIIFFINYNNIAFVLVAFLFAVAF